MTTGSGVLTAYQALLKKGVIDPNPGQAEVVGLLDGIGADLMALESRAGGFAGFLRTRKTAPKGAYIWGEVGRGKTLLMDLFFDAVPIKAKRRVHFHEFMDEIHVAIAKFRAETRDGKGARDPIPAVIKPVLQSTRLLCFDEFHVTDITNAMLLQRLFEKLFAAGVVVVATSNVQPDRLYENGLNRQLFLPFIDLLKAHTQTRFLGGVTDYRLTKMSGQEIYHFGADEGAAMDRMWQLLAGGQEGMPAVLLSLGRKIEVPIQAMGVARFPFSALCEQPLGARDYLKLANAYHTLIIDNVPQFDRTKSSAAKRFIQLVDTLYDRGVKLAASFAVPLDALGEDDKTAFEFRRCVSRLSEMRSDGYLGTARKGLPEL